jgi:3,5-epimerase/4-reductase
MDKVIIFGKGYLGTRISEEFGYTLIGRSEVDLLDFHLLEEFLEREKPDVVINTAGQTGRPNVDWCESHKEDTVLSNVNVASNLSILCAKKEIYFVHIGSGCIYEGTNNDLGYSEKDEPNFYGPQFYAKTKILAEMILREFPGLIVRVRLPIDDRPHERNLINKVNKYSKVLNVKNSITTVPHMLPALKSLIEQRKQGIVNIVNPGLISPLEIMEMYKKIVDPSHEFSEMSVEELNQITDAKRSNCFLTTTELNSLGVELPEIHKAIEECLLKYKEALK